MKRAFLHRWFVANAYVAGIFALCWLLLRSGSRPSRLAYPCQQAAVSTATLAFGAPLVAAILALRRKLASLQSIVGIAAAAFGLIATFGAWGYLSRVEASRGPRLPSLQAPADYRAEIFHISGCPQDPIGDRFPCFESMLDLMGSQGLKFYKAPTTTLISGPDGVLADNDVIVIKINYQWAERGGTNTDLLQGVIRSIVDHPSGFTGEIVVCENAQFASVENFDRADNNAQDQALSPRDVVSHFQDLGHNVSLFDWTSIRNTQVNEFSAGDLEDGYVLYPWDAQLNGAVSYPKFQTSFGTYISLRDGIWDPVTQGYDREHLKFLNLPVLKSHSIYGVTANVKDYMGVVTRELGTNSHAAIRYGLLGAHLGEVELADLNILDAIWINAHPNGGPSTNYSEASRRDELIVSIDPVAADLWATENTLIPAFRDNGYTSWPKADPEDPNSDFREYLDNSANAILAAGIEVTNDPEHIDAFSLRIPILIDGFESGDTSAWASEVP
ncbi:MAG: DUF362 domain-containing protein [Thermoanaerobaculia bacterium]